MTVHRRADRALFRFSGPEAHRLLNDVLTGIIPSEDDGLAHWWALLTPQGKILVEGTVARVDDALWIDVHASVADDFFKRMRMYKLRAKVEIQDLRATHVVGYAAERTGIAHADRRGSVDLGFRIIASNQDTTSWVENDLAYHARRIDAAIAQLGPDFGPGEMFAHDIGMDILDGIDFQKGCYVGQEVVSRMKHRGTARRRPVRVASPPAPVGTPIMIGERDAGIIGKQHDGHAVGIVRLDRVTEGAAISVADHPATLTLPAWATYQFGDVATDD